MGVYIILCNNVKALQINVYINFHLFCGKSGDIEVYEERS